MKDGYRIELVSPMGKGSPVDGVLRAAGAAPYHICYKSEDMAADIKKLESEKYKVIVPEAAAFDGRKVVFMMNRSIGMIEIMEDMKR